METRTKGSRVGQWVMAYLLDAQFEAPSLSGLRSIIQDIRLPYTGWALFYLPKRESDLKVRPRGDVIECWLDDEWDYWRVSRYGKAFMIRPYQEDFLFPDPKPGTEFDLTLPIWRVGEGLLHAQRLASALEADDAKVAFKVRWNDLHDRKLVNRGNPDLTILWGKTMIASEDGVESFVTSRAQNISATLPELVRQLTEPLYNNFNFFSPPASLFANELARMRQSNLAILG